MNSAEEGQLLDNYCFNQNEVLLRYLDVAAAFFIQSIRSFPLQMLGKDEMRERRPWLLMIQYYLLYFFYVRTWLGSAAPTSTWSLNTKTFVAVEASHFFHYLFALCSLPLLLSIIEYGISNTIQYAIRYFRLII